MNKSTKIQKIIDKAKQEAEAKKQEEKVSSEPDKSSEKTIIEVGGERQRHVLYVLVVYVLLMFFLLMLFV